MTGKSGDSVTMAEREPVMQSAILCRCSPFAFMRLQTLILVLLIVIAAHAVSVVALRKLTKQLSSLTR